MKIRERFIAAAIVFYLSITVGLDYLTDKPREWELGQLLIIGAPFYALIALIKPQSRLSTERDKQ